MDFTSESYNQILQASGTKSITWSKVSGTLPKGLKLKASTGKITGTPTKDGIFTFTVKAKNDYGECDKELAIKIGTKPAIKTGASLKAGTKGTKYSLTLKASGTAPLKWTLKSGSLPDGLKLGKSNGKISGTPTKTGTFEFKIKVANDYGSVSKSFTLKIKKASSSLNESNSEVQKLEGVNSSAQEDMIIREAVSLPENVTAVEKYNTFYFMVAAKLPIVSTDKEGLYDFNVELNKDVPEGAELIYMANSSQPSDDDEIVEFYDEDGAEISTVPASRKIIIAIWLTPERVYSPIILIKR